MADIVVQFRGTIYENGYGQIAQKVMRDKNVSTTAKAIYAYLCSFAGGNVLDERKAFPSVETMISELGISEKTFYKHRNQLIDSGYIEVEQQKTDGGHFERNIYYIVAVIPSSKNYSTDDRPVNSTERKNDSSVKSPGRKNYRANIKRSLTTNTVKELNTTTSDVAVVQGKIEQALGMSIPSLLPLLAEWIQKYGEQALIDKARFIGVSRSKWKNIVGTYRTAVTEDWDIPAGSGYLDEPVRDERYGNFYELFPEA